MIIKTQYEEFYRYCDFSNWLTENETINTASVIVEDSDGIDVSSSMVGSVSVDSYKKVKYLIKNGTAGQTYKLRVRANTSTNQKFECVLQLRVV